MRVIFWGTPTYALPTLNALVNSGYDLVAVVTQPDRRRGRGKQLIPSPVKLRAIELGLSVFTPEKLRDDYELQKELAELNADISIVVAFGQILPAEVLNQPLLGCWNGHGSLLPRWRGAGPIQWSILSGDKVTGVGIMAMEEGLDTGPVLLQESIEIGLLENANQLGKRLSELTASLMIEALLKIIASTSGQKLKHINQLNVTKQEQLEGKPTYARMLTKPDHIINWNHSAIDIHRKVMGLCPNAVTAWKGKRLKIITTEPLIEVLSKY
ncbi:MAG: methionyl-tRNA formyltransferase, partial [Prochlorococcus sp.]